MWPLLSAFLHWVPSVLLWCLHFTLLHACIYQHVLIHSWLPGHECFQLLAVVNVLSGRGCAWTQMSSLFGFVVVYT